MQIPAQAMSGLSLLLAISGLAVLAHAQSAPAFEVASVKISPPREGSAGFTAVDTDPAMVRYANISLKILVAIAYRLDDSNVGGGPVWLDSQHYDVTAKLPPGTPKDRIPAMLQTLLAERFKLAVHHESKEQRVYSLVKGKNGPRLKEGQEPGSSQGQIIRGGIMGHAMTMGTLAGCLSRAVGYEVVDNTGLTGTFDITLKWTPEDSSAPGPNIFAALQEQLGLKLEQAKASIETLVIDHAERIPTDN